MSSWFVGDSSGMNYTWPKRTTFIAITSKDLKVNPKCFWAESQSSMQQTTSNCWQPYQIGSESSLQMPVEINCLYIWSDIIYVPYLVWSAYFVLELIFNKQAIMKQLLLTKSNFLNCIWLKFCVVVNMSCMRIFNLYHSLLLQNRPMDNYKGFWTYWQTSPTIVLDNSLVYSRNLHITMHMCFNCVNAFHIYYDCFFWQWNILQNFAKSTYQHIL
jgi:hypothetical protein